MLDIKPFHFEENTCIEDNDVTIVNWLIHSNINNILYCYQDAWSFPYKSQNATILGENFMDQFIENNYQQRLRDLFGLECKYIYTDNVEQVLTLADIEIKKGKPTKIMLKTNCIPWSEYYGTPNIEFLHEFIITDVDYNNSLITITDGYYGQYKRLIKFLNVREGYAKQAIQFNFHSKANHSMKDNFLRILQELISNKDNTYNNMLDFANDIKKLDNLEQEKCQVVFVDTKLYRNLNRIIMGRMKYALLLKLIYNQDEIFCKLADEVQKCAANWKRIQHLLVKADIMKDIKRICDRIESNILQAAQKEYTMLNNIIL